MAAVRARALYANTADTAEELSFNQGDVLGVLEVDVGGLAGWWLCSLNGRTGIAPGNRLQVLGAGGASPSLSRRSSEREGGRATPVGGVSRMCEDRRNGSFRPQRVDELSTYDAPQTLRSSSPHHTLTDVQQEYDVPPARYVPPHTSVQRHGSSCSRGRQGSGSPAPLLPVHEYDTLQNIKEMSRALSEIQSGVMMNYDSPSALKHTSHSPRGETPRTSHSPRGETPRTSHSPRCETVRHSPRVSFQINDKQSLYDSPVNVRDCNSPFNQHSDLPSMQIYDSPHTLTRDERNETMYDSPVDLHKGQGYCVRGQTSSPRVQSPLCTNPRQHGSQYDVPAHLLSEGSADRGLRSALSNRSSVLSSVGSRSSACSGSSPSTSARSSAEVAHDVYALSAAQDNGVRSSPAARCNNAEGHSAGDIRAGSFRGGGASQQQQQQRLHQQNSFYDNRDSYLDDYSVPRSDSSIDSGISIPSGAADQQHSSTTNDIKVDQQMGGVYDIPSRLTDNDSTVTNMNHSRTGTVNSNTELSKKPPTVKPKPKSGTMDMSRPLPPPPSSASPRMTPGADRSRLLAGGESNGSKADISVIVSDSASEWNDDCDYVTIANDAELELKRKVEEASIGNHVNARIANEAFASRENRLTNGGTTSSCPSSFTPSAQTGTTKYTFQIPQSSKPDSSVKNSKFLIGNGVNSTNSSFGQKSTGTLSNTSTLSSKSTLSSTSTLTSNGTLSSTSTLTSTDGLSSKFKERLEAVKRATNGSTADSETGRVAPSVEPVIEFYATQADVILTEVEAAAGVFFTNDCIGNTDAGSFARRGRNVILAAHKLVYVSDAMARLGLMSQEGEGDGMGDIVQAANTLCESLKAAVVATRNAALLYPDATSRQRAEDCILGAVAECAELTDVIHANATYLLFG